MENRILTGIGYEDRIRSKLGVSEPYLSDYDINQPDCIAVAEANIIAQIPEYTTIETDSDLKIYLEYAVVLECCILLCPSMDARLPKKQSGEHVSSELGIDWSKKKTEFEEEKEACIMKIIDTLFPTSTTSPSYFTVTYPKRSW